MSAAAWKVLRILGSVLGISPGVLIGKWVMHEGGWIATALLVILAIVLLWKLDGGDPR